MERKLYKRVTPYGILRVLKTGMRYWLMAPVPLQADDWADRYDLMAWSVVKCSDGMPESLEYSKELKAILHDEPITLIVSPMNITIELETPKKDIYIWTGETQEEPETETDFGDGFPP